MEVEFPQLFVLFVRGYCVARPNYCSGSQEGQSRHVSEECEISINALLKIRFAPRAILSEVYEGRRIKQRQSLHQTRVKRTLTIELQNKPYDEVFNIGTIEGLLCSTKLQILYESA